MLKIVLIFIFLAFVGNMVFLDYLFVSQNEKLISLQSRISQLASRETTLITSPPVVETASGSAEVVQTQTNNACPASCVSLISTVKTAAPAKISPTSVAPSSKGEFVIPLGSGTVSTANAWTDIYTAQGSVDTSNYSKIKAIYFEVVMHAPNGGDVKAKLYDVSTPFSYDGQVLSTSSQNGQLLSILVPLISGNKTYRVQLSSSVAPGVLDSARIRIVTQ